MPRVLPPEVALKHARKKIDELSRNAAVRVAGHYAAEPWVRRAFAEQDDRAALVVGLFGIRDDEGDWPAVVVCIQDRGDVETPPRWATVFCWWQGERWHSQTRLDGSFPPRQYRGDPDGPPSVVNGDYPWLMVGASESAIEAGIKRWRQEPSSHHSRLASASPRP